MKSRDHELAALQREWHPPDGLHRSAPRAVGLTSGGWALALLAVVLLAGAAAAGVGLTALARRQAEEQRLLEETGVETSARVLRLERLRGDKPRYRLTYHFNAGGQIYETVLKVPASFSRGLQAGSLMQVQYVPSRPELNQPSGWRDRTTPPWLGAVLAIVLAGVSWLLVKSLQSQRHLLSEGRPAPAVVTHHTKDQHGKIYHYKFAMLSGIIGTGKSGPVKKPPAVGSALCILYDREVPKRNSLYPFSLVKLREH